MVREEFEALALVGPPSGAPYAWVALDAEPVRARIAHWRDALGRAIHETLSFVSIDEEPARAHGLGVHDAGDCPVLVRVADGTRVPGVHDLETLKAFLRREGLLPAEGLVAVPLDEAAGRTGSPPPARAAASLRVVHPPAEVASPRASPRAPTRARRRAPASPTPPGSPAPSRPAGDGPSPEAPRPPAPPGPRGRRRRPPGDG